MPNLNENTEETNDISMMSWAEREIELAIQSEKEATEDAGEFEYGKACYQSALKAYKALVEDNHSGMSIHVTKSILNRLLDGRCLTPIENSDDIWTEVTWTENGEKEYQCKRMSSLFKLVTKDNIIIYSDLDRVRCVDIESPNVPFTNGFATRLIDKLFPIVFPYLPTGKPFRLFRETFLFDPKNGDYDTVHFLYILSPAGQKIELDKYFKEDADGQMIPIDKEEWDSRKNAVSTVNTKG